MEVPTTVETNPTAVATAKTVKTQYEDAAYSTYVESPSNHSLYEEYLHYSFFQQLEEMIMTRIERVEDGTILSVLDVGCGNSVLGRKLLKRQLSPSIRVTGVDQSTSMLREARHLCQEESLLSRITLMEGSATNLPAAVATASFDIVMSGFVIVHMESKTMLQEFFTQVAQALKSGGQTLHITPYFLEDNRMENMPEGSPQQVYLPVLNDQTGEVEQNIELYDYFWSVKSLAEAAKAAGLVDVSIRPAQIQPQSTTWTVDNLPVHVVLLSARKP